jgi:chaperonin GroES
VVWASKEPPAFTASSHGATDRQLKLTHELHLASNLAVTLENTPMAVRPLEDRVLIKPVEAETRTKSGIFLPESAKEKPMQGKVVATGPGKLLDNGERMKLGVKKGDVVVYGKYAGTEVEIKNTTHLILRESELLGVLQG